MNLKQCQLNYDRTYKELSDLREKNIKYNGCIITSLLIDKKEKIIIDLCNKIVSLENKYLNYKNTIVI